MDRRGLRKVREKYEEMQPRILVCCMREVADPRHRLSTRSPQREAVGRREWREKREEESGEVRGSEILGKCHLSINDLQTYVETSLSLLLLPLLLLLH